MFNPDAQFTLPFLTHVKNSRVLITNYTYGTVVELLVMKFNFILDPKTNSTIINGYLDQKENFRKMTVSFKKHESLLEINLRKLL